VLARQKPTSNKLDAITFLANWMLENNPNKPQLQVPPELQQQLEQQQQARAAAAAAAAAASAARQAASSSSKAQGSSAGSSSAPEVGLVSIGYKQALPNKHCD
jgi:flagellar biosynthesis/type III secretory pathway protein FliH